MANDGLKHVVHRRVHLERSQPEYRKRKVGQFLEKKSDYKKRAERYHVREKIIKELSSKTRFRNEDEFNYKMIHGRIGDEGQVILESEESAKKRKLSKKAQVKSDLNHIDRNLFVLNHKQNIVKKKLEKMIGANPAVVKPSKPKHILFDLDEDYHNQGEDGNNKHLKGEREVKLNGRKETRLNGKLNTKSNSSSSKENRDKVSKSKDKDSKNKTSSVGVSDISMDTDELFNLSDTFDTNRELEVVRNKLEDRRNLTVAKYKKRQVRRVRNSDLDLKSNSNKSTSVRIHEFVTQRLK